MDKKRYKRRRKRRTKSREIIDLHLLRHYRRQLHCWWCGRRNEGNSFHAHHLFGRGMGGWSRFDIPENLCALCPECHAAHHNGNRPLTDDLLAVVAARLETTQDAIRDRINALRWGDRNERGQAGSGEDVVVPGDQRGRVRPPLLAEPSGDRGPGVEADEDQEGGWSRF
jgi:hypothetical protein